MFRGYAIGVRLVDEFLAKSGVTNCQDFKETAEVVAKVAFKMFLGINVDVSQWNTEGNACSLLIFDNPLTGTVERAEFSSSLRMFFRRFS